MPSNESSLSQIVEQSLNEIYVFDVESLKFVYANEASRRNLEYSLEELEQMTPLDIKPDHTIDSFMELVAEGVNLIWTVISKITSISHNPQLPALGN